MRRVFLGVAALGAFAACPQCDEAPAAEGEGDSGEGESVGEGEGESGEGEGEGDVVGEGEGEGDVVGEGEGEVVVGSCDVEFGVGDACGGDPVDLWHFSTACLAPIDPALPALCPDAVVGTSNWVDDGASTLLFTADAFAFDVAGSLTTGFSLPPSCVSGQTCSEVAFSLDTFVTCVNGVGENVGGCDCVNSVRVDDTSGGTYTAVDGVLTLSTGVSYFYCASADGLQLRETDTSGNDVPSLVLTP